MVIANHTGWRRIVNAAVFSLNGLRAAWRDEEAFRQECALSIVLAPLALWLGRTPVEHVLLLGSLLIVLIVELLNSAVEAAVDRVGTDHHRLSGQAKDLGSAAVFVSLLLVVVVWTAIGLQRLP